MWKNMKHEVNATISLMGLYAMKGFGLVMGGIAAFSAVDVGHRLFDHVATAIASAM